MPNKKKKSRKIIKVAEAKKNKNQIKVTVVTVTYNHEEYIKECLESLVCQKTNFRYQILVGDDCSTDGTAGVVREYANKYPGLIVPILRKKNVGSMHNFGDLCQRALDASEYIAFCDGDDYWVDENKLQKQVDYLEAHKEVNGCFCRSKMLVPENYFLSGYYKKNKDGNYYYPECVPNFRIPKNNIITIPAMINSVVPAPNSVLLRAKKDFIIPEWFYDNGYIGDVPFFYFNLEDKGMAFMPEVMCVYRRTNGSVTSGFKNNDENFLVTRPRWLILLTGLREYYKEKNLNNIVIILENRIKSEAANYLRVLVKYNMTDKIADFFVDFPEAGKIALNAYLSFYSDSCKMTRIYGWEGNKTVARDSKFMHFFKHFVKFYTSRKLSWAKFKKCQFLKKCRNILRFICYWGFSVVPKNKKYWAFTSFHNNKYIDNSKYYFEYVSENYPEIKAYWFTVNNEVYEKLKKEGYNVKKANSLSGIWTMARCKIAVTDHFRMTDYDCLHGFNARTKVVQLWHGVGLKSMGDGKQPKNTNVDGVKYSYDILPSSDDSVWDKLKKRIKYFRYAYARELFEKYFLFVCPGQERIDMIGKVWNIPQENFLMAGHPRNLPVYQKLEEVVGNNVIYAPTYKFAPEDEREMVELCLENLDVIQKTMEKCDGTFTIRLHPHTWRNYFNIIYKYVRENDRIFLDQTQDIYESLDKYKVIISDYSSITYDFMMFGRPAVFFCYDYERFCEKEAGFNLDYMKVTPGPKTFTWEDTMTEVEKYLQNPEKDSQWRKEVCKYFFDENSNGTDNSKRITEEIIKRLKIKKEE